MPVRVKVDYRQLQQLRSIGEHVLADLQPVCRKHVGFVAQASQALVPVGEHDTDGLPPLKSTVFVDGARINHEKKSVGASAGYAHPAAGAIHAGWHWGAKIFESPSEFLAKPFRAVKNQFRPAVAKQLRATLGKHFPKAK